MGSDKVACPILTLKLVIGLGRGTPGSSHPANTHPFPGRAAGDSLGLPSHNGASATPAVELSSLSNLLCPSSVVRS